MFWMHDVRMSWMTFSFVLSLPNDIRK